MGPEPDTRPLSGRRVVLGVTGGVAAYKAVELCRLLVDAGAHVSPILTEGAEHFVGRTTFDALASEKVQSSLWDEVSPIPHTRLGQTADVVVVAPATARLLADLVAGRSHDLLTATLLATRAPVVVCPAMHTEMWEHPAVTANVATLAERGVVVVEPESGRLAGGDIGTGRLAAPQRIAERIVELLATDQADLSGRTVVVSAGGTRERLDPVRYIGNRSSGKQGHAVAEAARRRGAEVTLVTTVGLPCDAAIHRVQVESAAEMRDAVLAAAEGADVVVMAAAVADFRPVSIAEQKLKKHDGVPQVVLEPTEDILAELGRRKAPGQVLVGFAAETTDVVRHATEKLERKNVDLVVANDVSSADAGFEVDTNRVVIVSPEGPVAHDLATKAAVANFVLDAVVARFQ